MNTNGSARSPQSQSSAGMRLPLSLVAALLLVSLHPGAQTSLTPPVFKAGTDLVQVEFSVLGDAGVLCAA
jgi:hypothetical protein